MDAIEQLQQDVREGRIGVDGLIGVIVTQQRHLGAMQRELASAQQRIAEREKKAGGPATAKIGEPFSLRAEEKRQHTRHPKKKPKRARPGRRGRLTTTDEVKLAERTEPCFPEGVPPQDCHHSHTRPVWR
jgi:transposase